MNSSENNNNKCYNSSNKEMATSILQNMQKCSLVRFLLYAEIIDMLNRGTFFAFFANVCAFQR